MLSLLRNRLGIPGVLSVIALVFAMAGGALAAKKYVITSTGQIKPSVLNTLKTPGPPGQPGLAGGAGPAGPKGDAGAAGKDGSNGQSVTASSFSGAKGGCSAGGSEFESISGNTFACDGVDGETGFTDTLPSGKTETGSWNVANVPAELGVVASVSFPIPLAEELPEEAEEFEYLKKGQGETVNCPGTAENPEAAPGKFCVYTGAQSAEFLSVTPLSPGKSFGVGIGKSGAILGFEAGEAEVAVAYGTWAITAP